MTFNFSFPHGGFVCPSYLVVLLLLQVSERTNCSTPYERHLITLFSSQAALNVLKDLFFLSTSILGNDTCFDIRCLVLSRIYWFLKKRFFLLQGA